MIICSHLLLSVLFLSFINGQSTVVLPAKPSTGNGVKSSTTAGSSLQHPTFTTSNTSPLAKWTTVNDPVTLNKMHGNLRRGRDSIISQSNYGGRGSYTEEGEEDPENVRRGITNNNRNNNVVHGATTAAAAAYADVQHYPVDAMAADVRRYERNEEGEEDEENTRRNIINKPYTDSFSPPSAPAGYKSDQYDNMKNAKTLVYSSPEAISREEVLQLQQNWGNAIKHISAVYLSKGDYLKEASIAAGELYGYTEDRLVLFKPTKATEHPFRPTGTEAMSYFVGGNAVQGGYTEDHGFAINGGKGWSEVVWENHAIDLNGPTAIAMGNYYFTDASTGAIDRKSVV